MKEIAPPSWRKFFAHRPIAPPPFSYQQIISVFHLHPVSRPVFINPRLLHYFQMRIPLHSVIFSSIPVPARVGPSWRSFLCFPSFKNIIVSPRHPSSRTRGFPSMSIIISSIVPPSHLSLVIGGVLLLTGVEASSPSFFFLKFPSGKAFIHSRFCTPYHAFSRAGHFLWLWLCLGFRQNGRPFRGASIVSLLQSSVLSPIVAQLGTLRVLSVSPPATVVRHSSTRVSTTPLFCRNSSEPRRFRDAGFTRYLLSGRVYSPRIVWSWTLENLIFSFPQMQKPNSMTSLTLQRLAFLLEILVSWNWVLRCLSVNETVPPL